jgi:hypothetical protein
LPQLTGTTLRFAFKKGIKSEKADKIQTPQVIGATDRKKDPKKDPAIQ